MPSNVIQDFPQGGPVGSLHVGFLNNHFTLGVGGERDEPVRMPRCLSSKSLMPSPTAIAPLFGPKPVVGRLRASRHFAKGMVLIKANTDVPIPAQHIGMDVFRSKAKRGEHRGNPIHKTA